MILTSSQPLHEAYWGRAFAGRACRYVLEQTTKLEWDIISPYRKADRGRVQCDSCSGDGY